MSKNSFGARGRALWFEKKSKRCTPGKLPHQPLILAVETSGRTGSVALAAGQDILDEVVFSAPTRHSAEIFGAVCSLLARFDREPEQIEHIYISAGPGSFTGLRIAVTMAKTMHLANNTKIVAVDTLDVIAANAADYMSTESKTLEKIAAVLDAKRAQFFIAVYQNRQNKWKKILPDSLMTPAQLLEKFTPSDTPLWLLGEGLVYYADKFQAQGIGFLPSQYWNPKASKVHLLGYPMALKEQFANPLTLQPAYLRRPQAEEKAAQTN